MNKFDAISRYANLGVFLLPCHWVTDSGRCSCGDTGCKSPGKHPISQLVAKGHKQASNRFEQWQQWWAQYPEANAGMALAPSYLVAIDIDPRNGGDGTFDTLETQHGKIESDTEQLTGGGGRHIVFVANEGDSFPGKLGAGIDVKHDGYIMVWPSNHASGGTYEWEASSDLVAGQLPSPRPDWLVLDKEQPLNAMPCAPGMGIGALAGEVMNELWSALSVIANDAREDWLKVGMAIHALDSGQDGYTLWESWSSTSPKFDPQDQARVWFSFHGKPSQLNKESIFFWAQQAGWLNPMKRTIPDDVEEKAQDFVKKLFHVPEVDVVKPSPNVLNNFPVSGLDELAAIIGASAYVNYPDASRTAAVLLACLAASRRYVGDNGEGTHIYMGLSSVSIGMIRYVSDAIQQLLSDSGMRHLFSTSRKSTVSVIYDHLQAKPSHIYLCEDFGKMLAQSKKQFGNGSMEHAIDTIASIYSKKILQLDHDDSIKKSKSDAENRVIYAPAMSMLGLVSQDQLAMMMKASEIGSGLMVAMMMSICDERSAITQNSPITIACPPWLTTHLATLRGLLKADRNSSGSFDFIDDRGDFMPEQIIVPIKHMSSAKHDAAIMAISDRKALIPLLHGARVSMRRIAIALAAWGNPVNPVVTQEIMDWTADFVIGNTRRFADDFGLFESGEGEKMTAAQYVVKFIIEQSENGASLQHIKDKCYAFKKLGVDKRRDLLEQIEDDGDIQFVKIGKRKVYIASRFVKTAPTSEVRKTSEVPTSEVKPAPLLAYR
jgi:hypothetical protein